MALSDEEDDGTVEHLMQKDQRMLKAKAQAVVFQSTKRKDLFREARQILLLMEKHKLLHEWHQVYYLLFLYVEIALKHNLHKYDKLQDGDNKKDSERVKCELNKVERRLEHAKRGMQWQYENAKLKEQEYLDEQKRIATAVTPPPMNSEAIAAALDALRQPGQSSQSFDAVRRQAEIAQLPPPPAYSQVAALAPPPPPPAYNTVITKQPSTMSAQTTISQTEITKLSILKVQGDGSCAFRSIAQGMHQGQLSPQEEKFEADKLRRRVVNLLRLRGSEIMAGTGMSIEQVCMMSDEVEDFNEYCIRMSKSAFAGETEFWLLAEDLQITIAVFMRSAEDENDLEHMITYGKQTNNDGDLKPVCLFWQRGSHSEAGNHYDCLLFA